MPRNNHQLTGREPRLGGQQAVHLTGMEPALGRDFAPLYGEFRVRGLEAPSVVGRRRPLVVSADYDPDTSHLIELIAGSNGYEVRTTDSGLECRRLVAALLPDVLVLNIRLPGIGGLELIRQIRESDQEKVRALPILVMDVLSNPRDVMNAFEAGADDYLEMPYDVLVMLRSWRRVTSLTRRPEPLTALLNEDAKIRQVALSYLLNYRPEGLVKGLVDLLWMVSPDVNLQIRWALRQLGTPEALNALMTYKSGSALVD